MTYDLTRAEVRIRVSCCADELNKISVELLSHVFDKHPKLAEKCAVALRTKKKPTPARAENASGKHMDKAEGTR